MKSSLDPRSSVGDDLLNHVFSLLHEAYTGEMIPVYDGSLIEWGLQGLPVERRQG